VDSGDGGDGGRAHGGFCMFFAAALAVEVSNPVFVRA
jgi:hypothetical protein